MEGGKLMNYRIEEKPEMILTGYKKHFTGAPYGKESTDVDFIENLGLENIVI